MLQVNMSLARHNELKAHYRGKATGIHKELENAGFDMDRDWSKGIEEKTGNFIFMQSEPKPVDDGIRGEPDKAVTTGKKKPKKVNLFKRVKK